MFYAARRHLVNGIARGNDVHGFYTKSARDTWVLENGFETARDALGVSAQAARPIGARKAYRLLGRADGFAMAVANGLIRHDRDTGEAFGLYYLPKKAA